MAAAHGRAGSESAPNRAGKPAPVATTPRHIRQSRSAGLRARALYRLMGRSQRIAFPGGCPSGCVIRLARTYRCGGSTGIATIVQAMGRAPVSRLTRGEDRPRAPITRCPFRGNGNG
ncbi:hypothetical protein Tharo_3222 [Thauera aromatica K172]|uniref:Uncharacterized protein n=1 Tax=Thauera aromatica K172 TaxID=44139 RepID=A0A2R4BSB5_THAAR|nr:hypothetical protein Tharo_3222 [Thauera aromatica K172]